MKKVAGYKIEEDVLKDFNQVAKDNAINKSQWIENKMKEYIEENAKK